MHIGNRIFPYPVLNRNEALSDYAESSTFKLEFDVDENGAPIVQNGEVLFKNLHYTITDPSLIELLDSGKLKGAFIVECSASVYRSRFDISATPYDLRVSAHEINGNVVASCYLYAAEDIADFKSTGFIPEYAGYSCIYRRRTRILRSHISFYPAKIRLTVFAFFHIVIKKIVIWRNYEKTFNFLYTDDNACNYFFDWMFSKRKNREHKSSAQ